MLAAYVTLFTVVFGGLAPSQSAVRSFDQALVNCAHDAPGHPLDQAPGHHGADGCCLAGCCTVGTVAFTVPIVVPAPSGRIIEVLAPLPVGIRLDRRPWASPRQTRGPPPPV